MIKIFKNILIISITLLILFIITFIIIKFIVNKNDKCDHEYNDYVVTVAPSLFSVGQKSLSCKKCNYTKYEKLNAKINLPQLYLDGSTFGISKGTYCIMEAKYFDGENSFESYATIKHQGHTSLLYEKKNYTIKFFEDELCEDKYKVSLNGWNATNKYCLKANYIDFTSSRNVVSSHIWSEVLKTNEMLDMNISSLEFTGGIDGFPTALFINDEYQGLYTFNIPKDEDTYEIADDENEAMFVINSGLSDGANFKSKLTVDDKENVFDLEYSYNNDRELPYQKIDALIEKVINNENIEEYFDIDIAIDYLITTYILGLTDNFAKNMILITYDGVKWIPLLYDLDTAFGLSFDGTKYYEYDFSIPKIENNIIYSGTDNLLWDRILNNYTSKFKERYIELRETVLDVENILKQYIDFINNIPVECYEFEKKLYPDIPFSDINQLNHISNFLNSRIKILDEFIGNL